MESKVIRIMPCLDIKDGRVVKGVNFINLRDAGDPAEHAAFYESEGADEVAMLDIAATVEKRGTRLRWVREVSSVISIPLTVGGGISGVEDILKVLEAGASKVSLNSAAVRTPGIIKEAAEMAGPERITVAVDGRRNPRMPSGFEVVVSGGTTPTGRDAAEWTGECCALGAGSILATSMDGDGTREGYDIEFTRCISGAADVPVIASGGAGKPEHFLEAAVKAGAELLLAASVFHFREISIKELKSYLQGKGVRVMMSP